MAIRVHRPLEVIAFNVNCNGRQCYKLSKQLQDLHLDVVSLSEAHLTPHERFFIPNYHFYRVNSGTALAATKRPTDRPPSPVSVEAAGVCIPTGIKVEVKVKVNTIF
jgi:hypothetical protein